jgi:DNA (cytosine-5)-methyltransferase 1
VASMSKGSSPAALTRKNGKSRANDRLDHNIMASDGGPLNPTWTEWLQGFPLGWTDCEDLETPLFPRSQSGSEGGS